MSSILEQFRILQTLNEDLIIHDTLNTDLFDNGGLLKEDVRKQLLKIADMFVDSIQEDNIPIHVIDYFLVGSNASYNYTDDSDIDVHILADFDIVPTKHLLDLLYKQLTGRFNSKYDIKVKGHKVELYVESTEASSISNGVYSLKQNMWLKYPQQLNIVAYDVKETELYKHMLNEYNRLEDKDCEEFLDKLYVMRKISLMNEGEFSLGNLIFKEFRKQGYIQELKERKYKAKSQELTLESLHEAVLCEKQWVEAEATDGTTTQTFAFYATDKNPTADLNTLLPVINGTQTGTYKQSLDKGILSTLKTLYKNNPRSFTLKLIKLLGNSAGTIPRITLMDRDLRKEASNIATNVLTLTTEQKEHITSNSCDKIYVHHINKHEDDNTFNNLLLIGYSTSDLGYASAVHQIAHNNKATPPVQLTTGTKTLPYIDCSTGHNGTVEFIIT